MIMKPNKPKVQKKTPKGFHTRVEKNKKRELKKKGEPLANSIKELDM